MKKRPLIFILSLIMGIAWGNEVFAQSKKELNFKGTNYSGSTAKVFRLDQDQLIIQFENLGVRVDEGDQGPFHGAATHIVGVVFKNKSEYRLRAFETWVDKDGDKLIWELVEKPAKDLPPGTVPGTAKIFAGTGKFMGMQGTMDWTIQYPKPFPEGTGRGICQEVVKIVTPAK